MGQRSSSLVGCREQRAGWAGVGCPDKLGVHYVHSCGDVYWGCVDPYAVAPLTREAAAAWADAEVRCANICSTWASSSTLM